MTPADVLKAIRNRKVDHRVIRHAVRLHALVEVLNEAGEQVSTYDEALKAKQLTFHLTRRGTNLLNTTK